MIKIKKFSSSKILLEDILRDLEEQVNKEIPAHNIINIQYLTGDKKDTVVVFYRSPSKN